MEIWPSMYGGFSVHLWCCPSLSGFKHCQSRDSSVWVAASRAQLALENSLCPTTLNLRPLEWWPGLKLLLLKSQYGTIWKLKISNLQNYFLFNRCSEIMEISFP